MKQIIQNARTGGLEILEVPTPTPGPGQLLARNHFSVVSTGTETLSMEFARKSMLGKARSRPDLTRQVIRKLREEGPMPTYRTVMSRLDAPQPLGYSSAGVVEDVGPGVTRFSRGDRVACAGAGYANHAEFVVVPEKLAALVPETVPMEQAAFATIGAIALQGLRVAEPSLGEVGAVIGLGLIGQVAVQLLRANGCRVLGIDLQRERVKQAIEQGAEWGQTPANLSSGWKDATTDGFGVDFALITASASNSAPLELAADLCRSKARIVMVGAMPMELDRRTFYEKELELRMSMSYGPGRYDRSYEEAGLDYPLPYVRWTENRNLQAFLALCASRSINTELLRPKIRPFSEALDTYEALSKGSSGDVAALFRYDVRAQPTSTVPLEEPRTERKPREEVGVAFIGAGNYAKSVLLPALEDASGTRRVSIVAATGASARRTAERCKFASCGTDPDAPMGDPEVDLVFIATRHDSHAALAARALRAGKAVWLEKPLALTVEELEELEKAALESRGFLTVGYNRRFSAHARAIRAAFAERSSPLAIRYSIAAGRPPVGTWVTDPHAGGGRVIGEVCHFVDLCTYLVGRPPSSVFARRLGHDPEIDDSVTALLGFSDGSTAFIEYLARTSPELAKERFEVSADERTARCENYRTTTLNGRSDVKTFNQDKGQSTAVAETIAAVRAGAPSPFSLEELGAVSRATFAILESAASGTEVRISSDSA